VSLARPPRKTHVEVVALTVEQARALLAAAAGNRFEALFELALKTGMRRGELLALRWEDVDLDKGILQVRGTLRRTREGLTFGVPKTAASRRQVVLSPSLVAALWRHRARQEEERQGVGDPWLNLGLVFPNMLGRPGHAQVSITLDRYSHMTPRLMSNAAAVMDRLLDEEA
jgi:integrase